MNEMNPLEDRLRSWSPRPPSSEIRSRLFRNPSKDQTIAGEGRLQRWFVPAAACIAMLVVFLQTASSHGLLGRIPGRPVPLFAAIGSNGVASAGIADDIFLATVENNLEWNVWDTATFQWTNEPMWTSSMGSLQLAKTNHLQ